MGSKREEFRFTLVQLLQFFVRLFQVRRQPFYFFASFHFLADTPHEKNAEEKNSDKKEPVQKKFFFTKRKRETEPHEKPEEEHQTLRSDHTDIKKAEPQNRIPDDNRVHRHRKIAEGINVQSVHREEA